MVKLLLKNGIDINIVDKNGDTALHYAIKKGKLPNYLCDKDSRFKNRVQKFSIQYRISSNCT